MVLWGGDNSGYNANKCFFYSLQANKQSKALVNSDTTSSQSSNDDIVSLSSLSSEIESVAASYDEFQVRFSLSDEW